MGKISHRRVAGVSERLRVQGVNAPENLARTFPARLELFVSGAEGGLAREDRVDEIMTPGPQPANFSLQVFEGGLLTQGGRAVNFEKHDA